MAELLQTEGIGHNNTIYLYSEIDNKVIQSLHSQIQTITQFYNSTVSLFLKDSTQGHIKLYINSPGGSVTDSLAGADIILQSKMNIYTYIEGLCASGATFLSIAGKERYMTKLSTVLIHQMRTWIGGTFEQIREQKKSLDVLEALTKEHYNKHTRIPKKVLDTFFKKDILLTAKDCLTYGIIDEIL